MKILYPTIAIFWLLIFPNSNSFSQFYSNSDKAFSVEAGIGIGGMDCATDLGGPRGKGGKYLNDINWENTKMSGSVYAGIIYKHVIGLRLEATAGKVNAYDSILKGIANEKAIGRYQRNLSFRSTIKELSLLAEFYPLMLKSYDDKLPRLSPYITAGIGLFSFNPKAELNGEWVELQPLHTEGQSFSEYPDRAAYSLTQLNIPYGVGIRYELKNFNLRFEVINRYLFTDYLDDVSTTYIDPQLFNKYLDLSLVEKARVLYNQSLTATGSTIKRGNVGNKDAYITINIKAGFKLGNGRSGSRRRSVIKCKTW